MEKDKSTKKSVSFPIDLAERAEARAKELFSGNFSAYLQDLIEKDLAKSASSSIGQNNPLLEWVQGWRPDLMAEANRE